MCKKVAWIGVAGIDSVVGGSWAGGDGGIIEDDNFVDGEDGEGASNATRSGNTLVVCCYALRL